MIERLQGQLVDKAPTHAVVDVHGVGFGVAISLATYARLPAPGAAVCLCTHLHVREDRLELFGFADDHERTMFRHLLGVAGIGPHSAQTVLSGIALPELTEALRAGRVEVLTTIKGIGRKTAERMVLDLRDKVGPGAASSLVGGGEGPAEPDEQDEAHLALVALGIAPAAARQALAKVRRRHGDALPVQDLIKLALRAN